MRWYPKLGKYTENFGGLGPRLVWPEGQNKAFYTVFPILAIFFLMFTSNLSKFCCCWKCSFRKHFCCPGLFVLINPVPLVLYFQCFSHTTDTVSQLKGLKVNCFFVCFVLSLYFLDCLDCPFERFLFNMFCWFWGGRSICLFAYS